MEELHSLDPRRQELLEARFMGAVSGNTGGSTGGGSTGSASGGAKVMCGFTVRSPTGRVGMGLIWTGCRRMGTPLLRQRPLSLILR